MSPTSWKVDNKHCWIQCNDPKTAKRLSKVKGAKVVAASQTGAYLRTFEVPWKLPQAREWCIRAVRAIYGSFKPQISSLTPFYANNESAQGRAA
jgi:hypothetical protein